MCLPTPPSWFSHLLVFFMLICKLFMFFAYFLKLAFCRFSFYLFICLFIYLSSIYFSILGNFIIFHCLLVIKVSVYQILSLNEGSQLDLRRGELSGAVLLPGLYKKHLYQSDLRQLLK